MVDIKLVCPKCKQVLRSSFQELHCPACGKAYTIIDGVPSFVEGSHFYEERVSKSRYLLEDRSPLTRLYRTLAISRMRERFFRQALDEGRDYTILDLACAGGWELFTRYGRVAGIDIAFGSIRHAAQLYDVAVHGDVTELPFEAEVFDWIIAGDICGHIGPARKDQMLIEMNRVLKTNGQALMIVETLGDNCLIRFARRFLELWERHFVEPDGHIGLEPPRRALDRLRAHGLRLRKVRKIHTLIWSLGDYTYRFDNDFVEHSALLRGWIKVCRLLQRHWLSTAAADVGLGLLASVVDPLVPLHWTTGLMVWGEKSVGKRVESND